MSSSHNESPVNPLPPVVVALALPIVALELWFGAGARGFVGGPEAVGWRLAAIQEHAFYVPVFDLMLREGYWPLDQVARFATYPFIHVNFTHMLMVIVFLLALGKMVGEIFSALAVLAIFFLSAIVGALAYGLLTSAESPLIGGYPAVYGLIGAFTFILWVRLGDSGAPQIRAFTLIGFLLAIQLVFGVLFGGGLDWVAEVAGFATGFLSSFVLGPGGWSRTIERLRSR